MKKLLFLIIVVLGISLSPAVHAGGHHSGYGGRHYAGHGWHGGGRGYYGGCGSYSGWGVGINLVGFGYAPAYYTHSVYYPPVYYVPSGHWEVLKIWVPVTSQSYWVNQYYDRNRDVWVLGHWETRLVGGYWTEQQVWVQ